MTKNEISAEALRLGKKYLSETIELEIRDYAKFFTKPELIQPVTSPTVEDMVRICNLCVDLQIVRERCVLVYLDIKRARNRLKRLEKELLSIAPYKKLYAKERNKEGREVFLYSTCKTLAVVLDKSGFLSSQCEIVLGLLDSHVWTLKANNKVLSGVPHET